MLKTKKFLALVMSLLLLSGLFTATAFAAEKTDLQFNENGKFTVLNFSDIQDSYPLKNITKELIRATVEKVNPDLIVLTGDNISSDSLLSGYAALAINEFMSIFEEYGIPVASVFGNHDDEDTLADKEFQMSVYGLYDCYIGEAGEDLTGCGTYNLPILSSDGSRYAFNLWFTDSGTYNEENALGGYACVGKDQIEWYVNTSNALKEANDGIPVPSINFQHIIVPEIFDALDSYTEEQAEEMENVFEHTASWINENGEVETGEKLYYALPEGAIGEMNETPCPPNYSNGQFEAFLQQGDVLATVSGHDHTNNFDIEYQGIHIINTPGVGFNSYQGDGDVVGARVFVLDENEGNYETYTESYFDVFNFNNDVARYRFKAYSDTSSTATKIAAWFKMIFTMIKNLLAYFIR